MSTTSLVVDLVDGRHRLRSRHGLLRAQRLHGPDDRARVALVGQTALLLGGDAVELQVEVGPGATLELSEATGTVAYHGRGRSANWSSRVRLGVGSRLIWEGQPFVVADGACVTRSTDVELAAGSKATIRETVVLGRSAERGGLLHAHAGLRRDRRPILLEDLVLDPDERLGPGLLGEARVIDSLLVVGEDPPDLGSDVTRFRLVEPDCTLTRFIGSELADSPLARVGPRARIT